MIQKMILLFLFLIAILSNGCDKDSLNENKINSDTDNSNTINKDTLAPYPWHKFVMGADLSYVNAIQDVGGIYRDSGKIKDPYQIFKNNGANVVRLRLWHSPTWQARLHGGKIYNDLQDIVRAIGSSKKAGLAVNLDLHLSDTWADPSRQETPDAWKNIDLNTLGDSIYTYTLHVLNYLKARSLVPEMIQIGNENNGGVCWPLGKINNNDFSSFSFLLKSGISAVREFSKTSDIKPLIILHVAQLQNAEWWANGVVNLGGVTDFDVIGISHYFNWSTVNTLEKVTDIIKSLKSKYNKKVMIVETAYPWTDSNADNYNNIISGSQGFIHYGVSEEAQFKYMQDLTQAIINGGGSGVMYWEPAWITSAMKDLWGSGSSWDNCTLFDASGNTLKGIQFFNQKYTFK